MVMIVLQPGTNRQAGEANTLRYSPLHYVTPVRSTQRHTTDCTTGRGTTRYAYR